MGIFKSVKKVLRKTARLDPFVKMAAKMLGDKEKKPDSAAVPASPLAGAGTTQDAALRAQEAGQRVAGAAVMGASADLLGDTPDPDEEERKRASRILLG